MKEIESIEAFRALINTHSKIEAIAFQGIDLSKEDIALSKIEFIDCIFMGCSIPADLLNDLVEKGNYIFPKMKLPYPIFKNRLYSGDDLYTNNFDKNVYQHYLDSSRVNSRGKILKGYTKSIKESFARVLHDHSISDALDDVLQGQNLDKVVAIMGGHGLSRTDKDFVNVVYLSRRLTEAGFIVLSGGGPGAMEATHLGAWFAGLKDNQLEKALERLQQYPSYKDDNWLTSALEVIRENPRNEKYFSIGIPTWLYGHEPATPFAVHIAKYFTNAIREESLLALAKGGIVFAPGSAGTMQEIFQDACQNHYETFEYASPMLFLNRACWMRDKPVFNVIQRIKENGYYKNLYLDICDTTDKMFDALQAFQEGKIPKYERHHIHVGTFNVLNLVNQDVEYYGSRRYDKKGYRKKTDWLAAQLDRMRADVVVLQEIFHEKALRDVIQKSEFFKHKYYLAMGERSADDPLLPMVAIVSKYPITKSETFTHYESLEADDYQINGDKFSRPILRCEIEIQGNTYVVFGTHLKSKRPNLTEEEKDNRDKSIETHARATLRSLIKRGMEANGLRQIMIDSLATGLPHFLMGDLNDSHNAVTNDIIGGKRPQRPQSPRFSPNKTDDLEEYKKAFDERVKKFHRKMQDYYEAHQFKLFQAKELLAHNSFKDFYFTHIHEGHHEALDHVYLSNDFSPFNPLKVGKVKQVKLYNDHLEDDSLSYVRNEFYESDHGQVVVKIELKTTAWK